MRTAGSGERRQRRGGRGDARRGGRGGARGNCGGADPRDLQRCRGGGEGARKPSAAQSIAWDDVMGFGFGVLRLTPEAFWGMTVRELGAVMRGMAPGQASLGRETFIELMQRYPD